MSIAPELDDIIEQQDKSLEAACKRIAELEEQVEEYSRLIEAAAIQHLPTVDNWVSVPKWFIDALLLHQEEGE